MNKRITRLCVELLNYNKDGSYGVGCSYKWSRGSELIRTIHDKLALDVFGVSYKEFLEMVQMCKENGNVIMDLKDGHTAVNVRRWSYHKKGK